MRIKYIRLLLPAILALFVGKGTAFAQNWNPSHSIGTVTGVYNFSYNQVPAQFVEIYPAAFPNTGLNYQWESSPYPTTGFSAITVNGGTSSYQTPIALTQTTYFRRKTTYPSTGASIYSNTIKITAVSVNWEDINYVREHHVITTGITTWTAVDQLAIGSKLQITAYLDGLGRSVEKVSRETATPASGTQWGDMVQFSQYDAMGREPVKYLPYTTSNQTGKFKTAPLTDQPAYFANAATYNETSAFSTIKFDNSPLNRVVNIKSAGAAWAAGKGDSAIYDMNTAADSVQILSCDYVQGDAPVNSGVYSANLLYKLTYSDENGNQVIEFTNKSGQMILRKVQAVNAPGAGNTGWISSYFVYDDFGLLRFQIQPEGVKYLDANSWSFAGTNGATVLAEQVFQYNYDDKGRTIWKKAPGAAPLNMIYDVRDRLAFTQDGNQAALSTPQWTAQLFDELDRPVLSTLINTTETVANLQADLAAAAPTSTVTVTAIGNNGGLTLPVNVSLCPTSLNNTSLNNTAITTVLKYIFYDNYNYRNAQAFQTGYNNETAGYSTSDPNVIPLAASPRTYGMCTGEITRILGSTSQVLPATHYYDDKGRLIQTMVRNTRLGIDITTLQYHFDGRLLSKCVSHTNPAAGYTSFLTLTKYNYDKLGRVISMQLQLGTNPLKTISAYDYDDVSRIKTKHLDPTYNNPNSGLPDLESLNYSYNIHNQITGINKDYALKTAGTYNKWGHFFGLYIGFDNRDNVFSHAQLNGQVTGLQWSTQGDDAQRKYDYTYDNAGRLTKAAYNEQQHAGDGWSSSKMDFSVSGASGQITYDLNGNLLTMLQKGVIPGTATPVTLDDLQYTYNSFSNKLQRVTDNMTTTSVNGLSGDFKDGANAAGTPDYVYDADGNVVVDLNKNAQSLNNGAAGTNGIHYNFLDKPDQIRIVGKGTIDIVYTADGEKLQRVFIPESGGASTITSYMGQYVYQETGTLTVNSLPPFLGTGTKLAYVNFEEGRIRAVTTTNTSSPGGYETLSENGNIVLPGTNMTGAWDYFIMDYQQNVRMILSEETHAMMNTCTMETTGGRPTMEDPVFGQTGAANEVEATRTNTPSGWMGNTSASVVHLGNISGHNIGPNVLQRVMAGDKVSAISDYYYAAPTGGSNPNMVANVLASLVPLVGGNATTGTLVHGNAANIGSQLNGTPGFVNVVAPAGSGGTTPQAYLTILFFDERFNFISAADGGVAQSQVVFPVISGAQLTQLNVRAPKNGYVYVYLSNRSDQDVYFDNFKVSIQAGNIIEENHYYAFGLRIVAISSKKLGDTAEGKLKNAYLYNGKELLDEDADLGWYDYGFRDYDPQIGRFVQLDPLTDEYPYYTPYQFAGDEPIANIDRDGLEPIGATGIVKSVGGSIFIDAGAKSAEVVDAGTKTERLISTLSDAVVTAKLPAKLAASGLRSVLTSTVNITVNVVNLVDNVAIGKPSPVQQATLEQRKRYTLIAHDQLDPAHPLIGGNFIQGAKDQLVNAGKQGYMWVWRKQGIQEDNDFWLMFMPLPKGLGLLGGVAGRAGEAVVERGIEGGIEKEVEEGGLNLFKRGEAQTTTSLGWKEGDRMLKLFDQGTPKLNWKQNSRFLRREMKLGKPIFDSFRNAAGEFIDTKGFLNAERKLLKSRGWKFNPGKGAWMPPGK